ncbi:hypothetical protein F7731_22280 [Cytobacillus depressus]|uniref:Uncharacterized protein n=1 Tax=Cytobacillus depressus TaxID=1602942 RepID=A0A6L3UZ19_9BACI|nr:hypothetical protein F7731_22280 [Cytobacillus depressus]
MIDEFKEKNDTLSDLVSKYQSFAEENEELKKKYSNERERLIEKIRELYSEISKVSKGYEERNSELELEVKSERDHNIEKKD